MPNAVTTLATGDRVGEYEILARVGAGGMGVVYRALDVKLQRTVALKFLPDELTSNESYKQQFLREARTASSLDHPNIGVIHGISEAADGRAFIVMAYYEGETLSAKLMRAPLNLAQTIDVAIQMTRGLAEAHARAVVHRDIKPSNVIVTGQNVAKIVDFGLARASSNSISTQTLSTSGTIGYMSPEQTMGKPVDQRTDIWALGTVIAEMCTGRNPFQRDSPAATILAILNEAPYLPDDIPIELRGIIYHALSKDPATRYQSCNEVLADLETFRSHMAPGAISTKSSLVSAALKERMEHASTRMLGYETRSGKAKLWWLAAGASVLLLLAAAAFTPAIRNRLFGPREEHVAVLPFENVGNDPANEQISEGLMESISSKLTNLESDRQSLWVVPASEVRRRKIADPAAAQHELGATVVIQGILQKIGQKIHLTLNLIDAKTLRQTGSITVEDPTGDFSAIEDEAVSRLAKLMRISVIPGMLQTAGGGTNPAAYELYLKALGYMQRSDKAGNIDAAISALGEAVKSDPGFALGFAELGEAYRMRFTLDKNPKWLDQALADCQQSSELDDRLPAVYVTLGRIHDSTGKFELALGEFQRALQLDPRDADALIGLAHAYESAGRMADAEASYKKAIALRPDFWDGYNNLGVFYDRHNRYDEAIAQLRRAVELTPDNSRAYLNLAAVLIDTGDTKHLPEAEQALKKSIELAPTYPAYANLGYLYTEQNRNAEAAATLEKALQINDKDFLVWGNLMLAYEGLGNKGKEDMARNRELTLLEQAAAANPRDGEVQSYLALLYAQKRIRDKSLARLQTALALSPDDSVVLENVGEAYEDLGDRQQALQYVEMSLQKGFGLAGLQTNRALQNLLADPRFRPKGK